MKALSDRQSSFSRSPIRLILDLAATVPGAIELEIGQPDFPTPRHIIEAAVDAARNEYTGYTSNSGMHELREAIVVKLARENGLHVAPENVMVTIGAMEAVFASMAVLLDPGDSILLPDPGYGNFAMASRILNACARHYPTLPDRNFEPDWDELERMIDPTTKAMLVNSPSNPTGAVYSESVMRECYDFCRRHDLYLISDETYDRLVFDGEHVSPAKWDDDGRVISIYSVSKTYSMTGWRVGYAVANTDVIAALTKIQEPIVSCVNTVAQYAAVAGLLGPQDCVDEMRQVYRQRRDLAATLAAELGLKTSTAQGAFYMLIDISGQPLCSMDFSINLLKDTGVAVGPGCAFGSLCDRYVRISLCASQETIEEGLARLASYLHQEVAKARMALVGTA